MKPKSIFQKILFFVIPLVVFSNLILSYIVYKSYETIINQIKDYLPPEIYPVVTIRFSESWLVVGITLFFVILVTVLFVVLFSVNILRPLFQLLESFTKVREGDLETRVDIKTGDELEKLGKGFNDMVLALKKARQELEEEKASLQIKVKARTQELEELTQTLEMKVKERTKELEEKTKELQEKLGELEKFHKLLVGRELKMAELKEKIRLLEEKMKKPKVKEGEN